MANEEDAIVVIGFVQEAARGKAGNLFFENFSGDVLRA
jgi:hypothetical protein